MAKFWKQNWFKAGVALVGAKFAGEYFFGDTVPGMEGMDNQYFKGDNLAGKALNYFGVTPFKGTSIGSSIYGAVDDFIPDFVKDGYDSLKGSGAEKSASFLNMFGNMGGPPSGKRTTQASGMMRSNTDFQAGQVSQIPIGKNGRVANALSSGKLNNFLSSHVKTTYIPPRILASIQPVGSTALRRVSVKRTATRSPAYTKDARIG